MFNSGSGLLLEFAMMDVAESNCRLSSACFASTIYAMYNDLPQLVTPVVRKDPNESSASTAWQSSALSPVDRISLDGYQGIT